MLSGRPKISASCTSAYLFASGSLETGFCGPISHRDREGIGESTLLQVGEELFLGNVSS